MSELDRLRGELATLQAAQVEGSEAERAEEANEGKGKEEVSRHAEVNI